MGDSLKTATPPPQPADRQQLRQVLRERRRALSSSEQQRAALGLVRHMSLRHAFRNVNSIALYIANDGELNPGPLLKRALALGKTCYLPVLGKRTPSLTFARYIPGDKLLRNRFGIPEPMPCKSRLAGYQLDMICVPLVGFDTRGNRLGMGGGFYDRTFAERLHHFSRRPLLIGLAHQCQQLDVLPVQPWDVPLDAIATDTDYYVAGTPMVR